MLGRDCIPESQGYGLHKCSCLSSSCNDGLKKHSFPSPWGEPCFSPLPYPICCGFLPCPQIVLMFPSSYILRLLFLRRNRGDRSGQGFGGDPCVLPQLHWNSIRVLRIQVLMSFPLQINFLIEMERREVDWVGFHSGCCSLLPDSTRREFFWLLPKASREILVRFLEEKPAKSEGSPMLVAPSGFIHSILSRVGL